MIALRPVVGRFAQMPTMTDDKMRHLPDEVILQIFDLLDVIDLVHLQRVSSRYCLLARDVSLWKLRCYQHSRAEALRRRQQLLNDQDTQLAELRNAMTALPGVELAHPTSQPRSQTSPDSSIDSRLQRARALANWEPGYPLEKLDYYEEYVRRHADIGIGWLNLSRDTRRDHGSSEATGIGILASAEGGLLQHAVAPMDDGSVSIWDVSARSTYFEGGRGRCVARSKTGLLANATASHSIMTDTGAVDCVSVDSSSNKAYFAVQNRLHEVDLNTLQRCSSSAYPFAITALSEAKERVPLTVGTNMTIHMHDPRDPAFSSADVQSDGELIGGSVYSHATLAQPGPLSILNDNGSGDDESSIWVAGRFTSLLNYDRRMFPRLRRTIHSGARIASICLFPFPFIPRDLDLLKHPNIPMSALNEARNRPGSTIIAAAEYKGKGSLEMYGLPQAQAYQNRQTASASKLLAATPHGGLIVCSDGDGNLKWMERDAFTHVRTVNINDLDAKSPAASSATSSPHDSGIWASTGSEMPGQGDITQKIIPLNTQLRSPTSGGRPDSNQSNLLLWTGDGRLGVLGFGYGQGNPLSGDDWHDALESQSQTAAERAREDAERQYGQAMRRALERNADEVRFVRGLGMF